MKLVITIDLDNDVFMDGATGDPIPVPEVVRILSEVVVKIEDQHCLPHSLYLNDVNGNRVGQVYLKE